MVTFDMMTSAVGHHVNLYYVDGFVEENVYVESYESDPLEEGARILYTVNRFADIADLERIEILD